MSTRSFVGYVEGAIVHDGMVSGGTVHAVYCHHDGYLSGVGAMLNENYKDAQKVKELISLGGTSSICDTIEETAKESYHFRDSDDIDITVESLDKFTKEMAKDIFIEYTYLFVDGQWYFFTSEPILVPLMEAKIDEDR